MNAFVGCFLFALALLGPTLIVMGLTVALERYRFKD